MPIGASGDYIGLLTFFSFSLSVIAAVLAIDMFRLLRTGEFGRSWRVLIIASVMFALMQALRMAEFLDWKALNRYGLSQIVELMFVLSLAYAFYLQRKAFSDAASLRRKEIGLHREKAESDEPEPVDNDDLAIDTDWSRLGAIYTSPESGSTHSADRAANEMANSTADEQLSSKVRRGLG